MFNITHMTVNHITSEPGDMTRYDYLLYKYFDEYLCMGIESTFLFPSRVSIFTANYITSLELAVEYLNDNEDDMKCNPHTLLEVCNTINHIEGVKLRND